MKMITMKSVIKSDKECMPSAIMALLRPHMPAMIFAADKMRLVKNPTQVTRAAFFSRISLPSFNLMESRKPEWLLNSCTRFVQM